MYYLVKRSHELSNLEIRTILNLWEVTEWKDLTARDFRINFETSEFHLLIEAPSVILCVARINFSFNIRIGTKTYHFPEFVGFVSAVERKGYGTELLNFIINNLTTRDIEVIGFCHKDVRSFYAKQKVTVMHDKAQYLREKENETWAVSDDDDILAITLSASSIALFKELNDSNLGYIV